MLAGCGETQKLVYATALELDVTELTLTAGQTETITATVLPEDATDKSVSWSSSDPGIAAVDEGLVTGVSKGTARITATAGAVSAVCTVNVQNAAK